MNDGTTRKEGLRRPVRDQGAERFRQRLKDFGINHARAMTFLRALAYNGDGSKRSRWMQRALAEHAVATATTDAERANGEAWARALQRGGRIKISTFPILAVSTDPDISVFTVAEIEEALSKINLNDYPAPRRGDER